jgi:hypothetical protein
VKRPHREYHQQRKRRYIFPTSQPCAPQTQSFFPPGSLIAAAIGRIARSKIAAACPFLLIAADRAAKPGGDPGPSVSGPLAAQARGNMSLTPIPIPSLCFPPIRGQSLIVTPRAAAQPKSPPDPTALSPGSLNLWPSTQPLGPLRRVSTAKLDALGAGSPRCRRRWLALRGRSTSTRARSALGTG